MLLPNFYTYLKINTPKHTKCIFVNFVHLMYFERFKGRELDVNKGKAAADARCSCCDNRKMQAGKLHTREARLMLQNIGTSQFLTFQKQLPYLMTPRHKEIWFTQGQNGEKTGNITSKLNILHLFPLGNDRSWKSAPPDLGIRYSSLKQKIYCKL